MLPPAVEDTETTNSNAAATDNNNIVNNNEDYNKQNMRSSVDDNCWKRYAEIGSRKIR
jgi:hypothetical protein